MNESKFYRLDICTSDSTIPFLATNSVLFSTYRKRKELFFGDHFLYEKFTQCKVAALELREEQKSKPSRNAGHIILEQYKQKDELNYHKSISEDGIIKEEVFASDGSWITLNLIHAELLKEILPLNAKDYKPLDIGETSSTASEYIPLDTLRRMYDIEHIFDYDYALIPAEKPALKEFCDLIIQEDKKSPFGKGYDTETTGLDFNLYSEEKIVGAILSAFEDHARYIPFGHNKFKSFTPEDFKWAIEYLYSNGVRFIAHGKIFETKIFLKYGINAKVRHCSRLLSTLVDPVMIKGRHALKDLEFKRTGRTFLELKQIFTGPISFEVLDEELTRIYACPDADNGERVFIDRWEYMKRHFPALENLYEMELELADLKAEQEYYGMRVDPDFVMKGAELSANNAKKMKEHINKLAGRELDVDSPLVLSNYLYGTLKAPVEVTTSKGFPSTGDAALLKMATSQRDEPLDIFTVDITDVRGKPVVKAKDLNRSKYPIVLLIREYKDYRKQQTGFYERINKRKKGDRFFFWINPNGTETGRQSSPMHQMSKECRPAFLPDSEEHYLIAADYCQMELRVNATLAGETSLVTMCQDPDVDIHRAIAAAIQSKEIWDISPVERQKDKARNFGVVYLMSGRGLALSKYGVGATPQQIKECQDSIDLYYKTFKRCARFIKENTKKVLSKHYIDTLYGRVRRFDELHDPNLDESIIASIIRKANNMPVQGISADIMKAGEVKMQRYIKEQGWDKLVDTPQGQFPLVRLMVSIHDEVLLSRHKSIPIEAVQRMILICMETSIEIQGRPSAPLFVGFKMGNTWGDGKKDELECPRNLMFRMVDNFEKTGTSVLKEDSDQVNDLLHIINDYRDEELKVYMEDLISRAYPNNVAGSSSSSVGSSSTSSSSSFAGSTNLDPADPAVIELLWNHLRHPKFTHELVARFPQSKSDIEKNGYLSHHDSMRHAIAQYLEFRSNGFQDNESISEPEGNRPSSSTTFVGEEPQSTGASYSSTSDTYISPTFDSNREDDYDLNAELALISGMATEIYSEENPDENEVEVGDYADPNYLLFLEEVRQINKLALERSDTVVIFFEEVLIDINELTEEQANAIIAKVWENRDPQGFYSVHILKGDQVIDAGFKIESLQNDDEIQLLLKKFEEQNNSLNM